MVTYVCGRALVLRAVVPTCCFSLESICVSGVVVVGRVRAHRVLHYYPRVSGPFAAVLSACGWRRVVTGGELFVLVIESLLTAVA